jgi:hypothetical protein
MVSYAQNLEDVVLKRVFREVKMVTLPNISTIFPSFQYL